MTKKIRKKQIEKNRTLILDAAKKLFASKGFPNTTMEDIAKASSLDRRTLYNHFKNKGDILAAMASGIIKRIGEIYNEVDVDNINSLERLKRLIEKVSEVYLDNSEVLSAFIPQYKEILIMSDKQKKALSDIMMKNITAYSKIEKRLVKIIQRAQEENLLIDTHPYILAGLLNEAIWRNVFISHTYEHPLTKEELAARIMHVVERGFTKIPENIM
jgi:AcrR family transcriptional regulator